MTVSNWKMTAIDYCTTFAEDNSGSTAIEYGLVAGGIAVTVAATVWTLGGTVLTNLFSVIGDAVASGT